MRMRKPIHAMVTVCTATTLLFTSSLIAQAQRTVDADPESIIDATDPQNAIISGPKDHYDQLPDLGSNAANFLSDYEAKQLGLSLIHI